ncbi:MAG: helix-turn-helix domain-containing protein [Alsobacter sp.]
MRGSDQHLIRGFPLFRGVPDGTFDSVTIRARIVDLPSSSTFLREGEKPEFLYVLLNGLVETFTEKAGALTTLAFVRPPTAFIVAAVWLDQVQLTSARTIAPSRILFVPAADVRAAMTQDPTFCQALGSELAARYRDVMKELKNQRTRSAAERLANWLLTEAQAEGSAEFEMPVSRGVLASRLGVTAEHLSRTFVALRDHGVLSDGRVIRLDLPRLTKFARPSVTFDQNDL